jgi:hypothetical protein
MFDYVSVIIRQENRAYSESIGSQIKRPSE